MSVLLSIQSRRRAFSAIEVLVSLAVLALLLALLMPALSRARQRAKITLCASNLRQIGQVVAAYRSDNRGNFPRVGVMPPPFDNRNMPRVWLYDALAGYLPPASPVYRCPADSGRVFDKCAVLNPNHYGISYNFTVFPEHSYAGTLLMWDYCGDSEHGLVTPFDPMGTNSLYWDGSVVFHNAGYSRWPKP